MNLGGGGKRTAERALQSHFLGGLRNWGWSGRCLFLFKGNDRESPKRGGGESRQKGGGERIGAGGVQKRFWGGVLRYVLPPPEFSTPLGRSLITKGPNPEKTLRAKGTLISEPQVSTPLRFAIFPTRSREKGLCRGCVLENALSLYRLGKSHVAGRGKSGLTK